MSASLSTQSDIRSIKIIFLPPSIEHRPYYSSLWPSWALNLKGEKKDASSAEWLEAVTTLTDHPLNSINAIILLILLLLLISIIILKKTQFVRQGAIQMLKLLEGSLTHLLLGARFHCPHLHWRFYNTISWVLKAHKWRLHEQEAATIGC